MIKGQVLADSLLTLPRGAIEHIKQLEGWILNVDGALNIKGTGIRIVLTTPEGSIIEQSFTLGLPTSNNEAEYEAVLAGLRATITFGVMGVKVRCDSSLIINQVMGNTSQETLGWLSTYNSS